MYETDGESTYDVKGFIWRSTGDDGFGSLDTGSLQLTLVVLIALFEKWTGRNGRCTKLVVCSHIHHAGSVLVFLFALETNENLQVFQLFQSFHKALALLGEVRIERVRHELHHQLPAAVNWDNDRTAELKKLETVDGESQLCICCQVGALVGSEADAASAF